MTIIVIAIAALAFLLGGMLGFLYGVSSPEDDLRYLEGHVDGYRKAMRDAGGDWT
jgi:hypothetical protein